MSETLGYSLKTKDGFYKDSDIPVNIPGIEDKAGFSEAFAESVAKGKIEMAETDGLPGHYNLDHLRRFHTALFKDFFAFAGEIRTVDIDGPFCAASDIKEYSSRVFLRLENEDFLKGLTPEDMVDRLTSYIAEVEKIHPFLYGSFEAMDSFFTQMCRRVGYVLDFSAADAAELEEARKALVKGDRVPMEKLLTGTVTKIQRKK